MSKQINAFDSKTHRARSTELYTNNVDKCFEYGKNNEFKKDLSYVIQDLLKKELSLIKHLGVMHLGFRYFLPNGKSFGCPTIDSWYKQHRDENFYKYMKSYLTQELIYLSENKFCYVTRADDQGDNQYLNELKKLGLNNSVGVYNFSPNRIDSFFFICSPTDGKQRDYLINKIQWLEHHANSLTKKIDKLSEEIINYKHEEFCLEPSIASEIFNNITINTKFSSQCINIIADGRKIEITAGEIEVLKFLKSGTSNKIIAYKLGLNEKTVERRLCSLKIKFCINSKNNLVTIANSPQLQPILH